MASNVPWLASVLYQQVDVNGDFMAVRMPKEQRREQLLSVAEEIVKTRGADALTLITLAEQAGVSKPVTYEHFATREGLLAEMYQQYDEKVIFAIQQALADRPASLESAARAISSAYMDCVCVCGPVYEAIIAALQAYPEWYNIKIKVRDFFVETYTSLLQPFSPACPDQLKWRIIALFGAMEEIAKAVVLTEIDRTQATDLLTQLFIRSLS